MKKILSHYFVIWRVLTTSWNHVNPGPCLYALMKMTRPSVVATSCHKLLSIFDNSNNRSKHFQVFSRFIRANLKQNRLENKDYVSLLNLVLWKSGHKYIHYHFIFHCVLHFKRDSFTRKHLLLDNSLDVDIMKSYFFVG